MLKVLLLVKNITTNTLLIFTTLFLVIGCGKSPEPNSSSQKTKGTSDGGGGIITGSTKKEVKETIYKTRERLSLLIDEQAFIKELPKRAEKGLLTDESAVTINIIRQILFKQKRQNSLTDDFANDLVLKQLNIELQKLTSELNMNSKRMRNLVNDSHSDPHKHNLNDESKIKLQGIIENLKNEITKIETARNQLRQQIKQDYNLLKKKFSDFLMNTKLVILENKPCHAEDKKHADASVSENTLNATVCFSLKTLTRIPKITLEEHIAGLWFHELSHMSGFNEEESQTVEKITVAVYKNFNRTLDNFLYNFNSLRDHEYLYSESVRNFVLSTQRYLKLNDDSSEDIYRSSYKNLTSMFHYLNEFSISLDKVLVTLKVEKNKEMLAHAATLSNLLSEIKDPINVNYNSSLDTWSTDSLDKLFKNSIELKRLSNEIYYSMVPNLAEGLPEGTVKCIPCTK